MEKLNGWFTPPQDIMQRYAERCEYYSTHEFSNFKQDKDYQTILEGNERIVGEIALQSIKDKGGLDYLKVNLDKFKENELVGNPTVMDFDGMNIAPSTLRYVNTLVEIRSFVENPKRIIEIGGGYGGLCKTLSVVWKWDSYKIIDIPSTVKLCDKYLKHFKLNAQAVESCDEESDLVIADSSLAECDIDTQLKYAQLIKKSKYAYVVYNTLHVLNGIENYNRFVNELSDFLLRTERTDGGILICYFTKK